MAVVNGTTIDRGSLREALAFEEFLYNEQIQAVAVAERAGHLSTGAANADDAALGQAFGDPVETARNDLIDQTLTAQLAKAAGVTAHPGDPWAALATFLGDGFRRDLRWIDIGPAAGAAPNESAAGGGTLASVVAAARVGLIGGASPTAIAADLHLAGRQISGDERWIGASGPAIGIDDELLVSARTAAAGSVLGPVTTRAGHTVIGLLAAINPDDQNLAGQLAIDAQTAKLDTGTVAAWATHEALAAALESKLVGGWLATPTRQVRGQEFVVGPSAVSGSAGPWVDLVALDVSALSPGAQPSPLPAPVATPELAPGSPGLSPV
ncbi:MAG: hypothetical protein ACRDGQ_07545, partial [Candidatus Limnocylindrales bacterium]